MQPPKETEAPALPHIVLQLIKQNASSQSFVTLPGLRDEIISQHPDWQPDTRERERLYNRIRTCISTVTLIDKKVLVKEALTTKKTKIIKIYYNV